MSVFKNLVRFCFTHERIRIENGTYLKLETGTLHRLSSVGIPCQHEPCDFCESVAKRRKIQPRLFEEE